MTNLTSKDILQRLENFFFFAAVLFLPTQLGKHFWPDQSYIYSLRIDYLSPTIYFWDILVLMLCLIYLLSYSLGFKKNKLNFFAVIIFGIFFATQAISIFSASNITAVLVRLKEYLSAGLFGIYLATVNFREIKNYFFSALFLSVFLTCILGISQFLSGHSLGVWILGEREFSVATPLSAKFNFYNEVLLRPYSTFSHPNLLAAFLVLSLPLIILGTLKNITNLKVTLSLLSSITILITFSRPALILLGIQMATFYKSFWKIMLILLVIVSPFLVVRFSSIFTFDSLALLRRQELAEYAITLFLENPIFGVGLNNFINLLALDKVLVGTSRFLQPVHNIFLLTLSETGILGFLGLVILMGSALVINLRKMDILAKVLTADLLMIIFLGFFDHYFLTLPQGQRLLFLIFGLSFNKFKAFETKP